MKTSKNKNSNKHYHACEQRQKSTLHKEPIRLPNLLLCPLGKKSRGDITWWPEDMNFIFKWQNNILITSAEGGV